MVLPVYRNTSHIQHTQSLSQQKYKNVQWLICFDIYSTETVVESYTTRITKQIIYYKSYLLHFKCSLYQIPICLFQCIC